MKKLASLMAMLMVFSLAFTAPEAEAKRFGGGKSFGRSFKTAPAPKKPAFQQNRADRQQQNTNSTQQKNSRKGMLGGLLGGLLAGGLIASLLGGGAFGGIGIMDILILGLLAFVLFKVFRSMNRAKAMAGNHSGASRQDQPFGQSTQNYRDQLQDLFNKDTPAESRDAGFNDAPSSPVPSGGANPEAQTGFGASDVPMNVPSDFNLNAFLNGARDHYRTLQEAWNRSDFRTMQEYLDPELFKQMKPVREQLQGDQHTEVMFVDAEMVRADYTATVAQISIRFTGKYRDTVEGMEEDITDIWHLERDLTRQNAPWRIIGIES
ncbi:Tim44-like domain-containing protein [Endozoicomonas gorgoniicola]|uniref:Tim44-like domain-containing protein n=1 Tax=Endozoicomonas gorgoniicola TaxID=1234144 RepID=A0ABT3MPN7_9GAMM|nr:Tim44-like domain-containing protein [Endozoicomonas gorgoniicola]MCW7551322.1 Tim44-like domain-containing protein [Endozoicomonas gorgoniicola]